VITLTTLTLELDDQIFHQLESYAHHSKQNIQEAIKYLLLNQLGSDKSAPKKRQFGQLKGLVISVADDFNAPLDDFKDYMS
jgi:hypothetical protein